MKHAEKLIERLLFLDAPPYQLLRAISPPLVLRRFRPPDRLLRDAGREAANIQPTPVPDARVRLTEVSSKRARRHTSRRSRCQVLSSSACGRMCEWTSRVKATVEWPRRPEMIRGVMPELNATLAASITGAGLTCVLSPTPAGKK